jgi:hypothetical protein
MALVLTLFGLCLVLSVVSAVVLAAALREEPMEQPVTAVPQEAGRPAFFGQPAPRRTADIASTVPVEVLLLELERHIRLEQAAAESFHRFPTPATLHRATASPLVH